MKFYTSDGEPLTRVSVVTRRGFLGDTPGILTHYIIPCKFLIRGLFLGKTACAMR